MALTRSVTNQSHREPELCRVLEFLQTPFPTSVALIQADASDWLQPPSSSCPDQLSVPNRESLARVLRLFQLIHECDRKVFGGYAALAVSSNQKFVFTESKFARAFAGSKKVGWR